MQAFTTARDAKEFIVNRIAAEALRQGVPLSEVERKMLYFSETAWTLPDMAEVNAAFDQEYDQAEYEERITKLTNKLLANARADDQEELDAWTEAVRTLSKEDHYLLVMVPAAKAAARPRGDVLKPLATALAIVCVLTVIAYFAVR